MCLTVKDNNCAQHPLPAQEAGDAAAERREGGEERQVGEEKQGSGVDPGAVHEMRKVLQGKTSDYWRCAALGSEISPEVNCYDRRRRLVAVRRLQTTVVVPCTSRPSSPGVHGAARCPVHVDHSTGYLRRNTLQRVPAGGPRGGGYYFVQCARE